MSLLEKLKDDFDEKRGQLKRVELDELDGTVVYVYERLSLDEWQRITEPKSLIEKAVVALIVLCRNSEGEPYFTDSAKKTLMSKVDANVLIRSYVQVQGVLKVPSFEEAVKN